MLTLNLPSFIVCVWKPKGYGENEVETNKIIEALWEVFDELDGNDIQGNDKKREIERFVEIIEESQFTNYKGLVNFLKEHYN